MATEVGTAYLSIVAATKGMTKDIKKAFGEAEGEGSRSGQGSGKGFLGGLGKTLLKGAALLGVGALVGKTISLGMTRAISIENSKKKLEGLGHSASSVTSIMDSALKSVKGTAYGLGDAASTAAMMAAAGVKNGTEMTTALKTVADTAAISGRSLTDIGGIFSKVAAKGKLQGNEIFQLTQSGIPALQLLSKHLGISAADVSDLVSKGKIDFATFEAAMRAGMGGAALKTGETFSGALANMNAALGRLGAAFMAPALEAAKPLFAGITAVVDALTSKVGPLAAAWGERLVPAAEKIGAALTALASGKSLGEVLGDAGPILGVVSALSPLSLAFKALQPLLPQIGKAFADVLTALAPAVPALGSVAATLGGALAQALAVVVPAMLPLVVKLAELAAALLSNEPLLYSVIGAFAAFKTVSAVSSTISTVTSAVSTGTAAWNIFSGALGGAQRIAATGALQMNALKAGMIAHKIGAGAATAAQWLWNAAMSANPIGIVIVAIAALVAGLVWFFTQTEVGRDAWASFTSWLSETWTRISDWAVQIWGGIADFFTGLWAGISEGATAVWDGLVAGWDAVVAGVTAVWEGLKIAWQVVSDAISGPVQFWLTIFTSVWESIKTVIATAFLVIHGLFTGNLGQVGEALSAGWEMLKEIWSGAFDKIKEIASTAWEGIKTAFSTAWESLKTTVSDGWDKIKEWFATAGATISQKATEAWGKVKAAFEEGIDKAIAFVKGLPGKASAALSSLGSTLMTAATTSWNSFKTATVTGINNAINFVKGLPGKIKAALAGAGSWLVSIGKQVLEGFINGAKAMVGRVKDAVLAPIKSAVSATKNFLGIKSPSRLFIVIGEQTGQGLEIGIGHMIKPVADAASDLAAAAVPDARDLLRTVSSGAINGLRTQIGTTVQAKYDEIGSRIRRPDLDTAAGSQDLAAAVAAGVREGLQGARLDLGRIDRITNMVAGEVVRAVARG